jgi:hypothetical protein
MCVEWQYSPNFFSLPSNFFIIKLYPLQHITICPFHFCIFFIVSPSYTIYAHVPQSCDTSSQFPSVTATYIGGGYKQLHLASSSQSLTTSLWRPHKRLPVIRTSHPLDVCCTNDTLQAIQVCRNQEEEEKISNHPIHPLIFVQVKHLRSLISHSSMISDVVVIFYLEMLTRQYDITCLSTSIMTTLQQQGWQRLQSHFALYRNRPQTNSQPWISRESAIILPCFVDGCHWVNVVRREVNGQVLFLYADNLNRPTTEQFIRDLLSQNADFFPATASWINCINYTYRPHSNECGPRSLLAATILALHPHPSNTILLPAMHPKLAQILRTWLGCQITTQTIDDTAIKALLHTSHGITNQRTASSLPAYLFQWAASAIPLPTVILESHNPSKLRATAPIFHPRKATDILEPISQAFQPDPTTTVASSQPTITNIIPKNPESKNSSHPIHKTARIHPTKRTNTMLPGKRLLTTFLRKKETSPYVPVPCARPFPSLSLPTLSSSQCSNTSTTSTNSKQRLPSLPMVGPAQPAFTTQRTLYDFAYFKPQSSITEADPEVWGHMPEQIDTSATFQILLQNPNGIQPSVTKPEFLFSLHISHEIGVGALCLAETNLNWHHSQHKFVLKCCLHQNWQSSKFQTSVPDEVFLGNYQPGGTATIVVDCWTSCVLNSGMDPYGLGRWSYVILRGKSDTNICIITAYRVCNDRYTGPKTAYQQQKRQL